MARICEQSASYAGSVVGSMWLEYSLSTNNDTTAVITARPWVTTASAYTMLIQGGGSWTLYNTTADIAYKTYVPSSTTQAISTQQSVTIAKTHEVQYIGINYYLRSSAVFTRSGASPASADISQGTYYDTIRVEQKTHWSVTYNANGGTGAPATTTKWYGETMTIPTAQPTRTGYTFKGWATSATGSAVYASGGAYVTNAGATLYAVWEAYHYDVTYNANGGTGAPQKQTKDYGTNLRLTTATPTLEGYTFLGWATSTAIASTGQVEYQKGGLYQTNAPITLYAVWELTYQAPTITEVSIERCQQNGSLDDDGEYASVGFAWTVFKSNLPQYVGGNTYPYADNAVSNCTITVGTQTATPTLTVSPASEVVGSGTFNTDVAYATTISITDNENVTTIYSGTLALATFPLDYNADASAVGFFRPAPDNGSGAYFAKNINADGDINIAIDTTAGSGVDYDITTALSNLNWTDVYV